MSATCRCGHLAYFHRHTRDGSDCGICGSDICRAFIKAPANIWMARAAALRHQLAFANRRADRAEHQLRNFIALHRFTVYAPAPLVPQPRRGR